MRWISLAAALLAAPAVAQQQQKPTVAQIVDQIMENELRNYRMQIAQMAEQLNKLTEEKAALQKELDDLKAEKAK